MFSLINNVSKAQDNKESVFGIFIDRSKAFDLVNLTLLINSTLLESKEEQ